MNHSGPWRVTDLVNAAIANVLAGVLLFAGWYITHDTTEPSRAVLGVDLAVGGLAVALAGNISWLLTGLREVGAQTQAFVTRAPAGPGVRPPSRRRSAAAFVTGRGMSHYHRPDCLLARHKELAAASARTHTARGRSACPVCRPDTVDPRGSAR